MSDHDPFAEPDDTERTVIKPNPGGRRSAGATPPPAQPDPAIMADPLAPAPVAPVPAEPAPQAGYGVAAAQAPRPKASGADNTIELAMTGMNPLNACAATLFSLVSRIRNRAQHMDPDALRRSVVAEVRGFETRALQAKIDPQSVKVARYAICATLDDVVLNTPWGGQSVWAQQSMVGTFHRETVGGDRFYDLLARLEKEPANNIDLLEFLYICLSLGFEGRLRVEQGGPDKHLQIRNGLARIIRANRGELEHDLSPHWKGLLKPHRALSFWKPVWITSGILASILALSFVGLTYTLSGAGERVIGQLSVLEINPPAELIRKAPPPPPPPPPPEPPQQLANVKAFLSEEITDQVVEVFEERNTIVIRISGSGMFGSASDSLQPDYVERVRRVASSLDEQSGPILVTGHSDNVPINTARFPSNMHLSLARAQSVAELIQTVLAEPDRVVAEGRAEKDPIASNATPEGRAENRRIEIVIVRNDAA